MRLLRRLLPICVAAMVLSAFFRAGHGLAEDPGDRGAAGACATVSFVEGTHVLAGSASVPKPVAAGQVLCAGSAVQTDSVSRVELALADGGIVRLAGDTTVELGADAGKSGGVSRVVLLRGQMWANFSKQHREDAAGLLAAGAVFTGPGSVFRAVLSGEGAVEVKAYTGQVTASGPFEMNKENGPNPLEPKQGGEEGTPEPWRHQIAPYQKIIVLVPGEASQPFRFAAKSDSTEWVRWNQQRDGVVK